MKRHLKTASVFIFSALALASCAKTEEFQHNPDSALQIESVSGISPFTLMQNPVSKAVITGESLPGDEAAKGIGLFVTAQDGGAYDDHANGYTNVKFVNNGSGWSTSNPVYLSDTQGKLYGYFPYNADAADLRAIPVASSLNGTDYLYAKAQTVSHSNKNVSLEMNHALSRLHLTIKKGEKFKADAPLTKITLQSTAIDATGTMDLTTGAVTATKKATETGTVELSTDGTITAEGIEKDILLVPADGSEGKKDIAIILIIDNKSVGITLSGENGIGIRSGIQNNVILTIEDTGIKVEVVGVGAWGEGGSQQIQVGKHTVTIKLSNDTGIDDDVLMNVKVDGENVIIKANSFQGKWLVCDVGDKAQCERAITNDKFTFTISEIMSNIEAVLAYAPTVQITVTSDSNGKVWIGDDESRKSGQFSDGQQVMIHAAPNDKFRLFKWDDNDRETSRTITVGNSETTYSASFISVDLIPGLFTVNTDQKQVFFSKGNLWADGNNVLHFEDAQWKSTPASEGSKDNTHVCHFTWSSGVAEAVGDSYSGNNLFCDESHKVSVDGGEAIYYALSKKEWTYLFNNHSYKWASVKGVNGYVIAPDDFSGELAGTYSDDTAWNAAHEAGVVFLPAAGRRSGSDVINVGNIANYWSSTALNSSVSYCVYFNSSDVVPDYSGDRDLGYSVRLITECQ